MIKYKYPMLWACAKEICRIKGKGGIFRTHKELNQFVKENRDLLPDVVDGYAVVFKS